MKKLVTLLLLFSIVPFLAQENTENSAAQANNPLANMTAISLHNYYIPKLTDAPDDAYMNTSWVRFAKPLAGGKLLMRVSAPLNTIAMPDETGTVNSLNGLGDINAFVAYTFISNGKTTLGAGPIVTMPTATEEELGTGKWQGGVTAVAYFIPSAQFQFGGLISWQASFAGQSDRENTNNLAIQSFYFWQLGKGTYLRGAPVWYFDLKQDAYSVPFALGIGKIVRLGNTTANLFIEPEYAMLHQGTQPQFQLFMGMNFQFSGK